MKEAIFEAFCVIESLDFGM